MAPISRIAPVLPLFLSYVLSFVYLAIYWNNHIICCTPPAGQRFICGPTCTFVLAVAGSFRDRLDGRERIRAGADRALWRSVAVGANRLLDLAAAIIAGQGDTSLLAAGGGPCLKGKISPVLYLIAIHPHSSTNGYRRPVRNWSR